ncbi:MAG: 50S ribosomal protein L11 methyltransferase [Bacteroides sp.]
MQYFEYTLQATPFSETATDLLSALLGEVGFESFVVEDQQLKAYIQAAQHDEAAVSAILADFPMPDVTISFTHQLAEDRDWNEEWEKNFFQPIVIGDRCCIHSTFHKDTPHVEYDIIINPQMAFGTGHHETTGLILGELLDSDLQGRSLLDMGCGTAILAILGRMRGAAPCTAIDIDDWCVRNSLDNIALNGMDQISVFHGDASILGDKGPFDYVIANINRNILLADMARYVDCMNPGATLLMSGFYVEDIPVLRAEAERLGLQFVHHRENNRWAALRFTRP